MKRAIALVLTIVMLVALLPATVIFGVTTPVETTLKYDVTGFMKGYKSDRSHVVL